MTAYYSLLCTGCSAPLIGIDTVEERGVPAWMSEVVLYFPDGNVWIGKYDGFGRIHVGAGDPISWARVYAVQKICTDARHQACDAVLEPSSFQKASLVAKDRGRFFEDGFYDYDKPRSLRDVILISEKLRNKRLQSR